MQLHKRDVIDAATAILDNFGMADLTMRRLARELAVSPGALYWHFANKQELLGAVADRILQPALEPHAPPGWRDQIAEGSGNPLARRAASQTGNLSESCACSVTATHGPSNSTIVSLVTK